MSVEVETGLVTYFTANVGVAAVIAGKMYPHEAPQAPATPPYLVYQLRHQEEKRALGGAIISSKSVYSIACCDSTFDASKLLAATVKAAVVGIVETTFAGVNVAIFWDEVPENDSHTPAQDKLRFQVSLDLIVLLR